MHEPSLLWSSLAAVIVLLVPGGALLSWLALDSPQPAALRPGSAVSALADAAALSISITSLLAMLGFLVRLSMPGWAAGLFYAAAFVLLAAGVVMVYRRWLSAGRRVELTRALVSVTLALVFFAVLSGWRLYQARALSLPAWVDSVHHTLVVRLIMERGGLPADMTPYLPVAFFYHYGFHLAAALFAALAGVSADQAVLWFGQALNAAVAFSVYRAGEALLAPALRLDGNSSTADGSPDEAITANPSQFPVTRRFVRLAPLVAALLVGFVFQMPAYYLTWGRYTLLAGMLLVGPALAAACEVWAQPRLRAPWVRLALLITGLALTHIFALLLVSLFLALMGAAAVISLLAQRFRPATWDSRAKMEFLLGLAIFSVMGLLLAAPWTWRIWEYNQQLARVSFVNPVENGDAARQGAADYLRYLLFLIGPRRSHILMGFAGVGLAAALHHPGRRFLAAWGLLLALLSLPWGLRINPFRPDYFAIVLFFPASLLLSGLLTDGAAALAQVSRPRLGGAALALAAALLFAWGVRETQSITNRVTIIATAADVRALDWINANLPGDARFFTNTAGWSGDIYRGVDGGYWLLPYTGRVGLVPPVFYSWAAPDYVETVTRRVSAAAKIKDCSADFWNLVDEAGLTHIYLREGTGSLQPNALAACPNLRILYQEEGVFLYEIAR